MRVPLLLAVCSLTACITVPPTGKNEGVAEDLEGLKDQGWTVRQTLEPGNAEFEEPARIQLKDPSGDGNTEQLIDVAVMREFQPRWSENLVLGPAVEYHRNSEDGAEVDNLTLGISGSYTFREGYPDTRDWFVVQQLTVAYREDKVTDSDGLRVKAGTLYLKRPWFAPPATKREGRQLTFLPSAGFVYDDQSDVGGSSGSRWLAYGKAQSRFYLWPSRFVSRFYLEGNATYWRTFSQSGGFDAFDRDARLYKFGLNYFADPDEQLGLSLEYQNGENPETGQLDSEFITFLVKLKL